MPTQVKSPAEHLSGAIKIKGAKLVRPSPKQGYDDVVFNALGLQQRQANRTRYSK